jgi:AmmeMemoRadiSam system protein A
MLDEARGEVLLQIARDAIAEALGGRPGPRPEGAWLDEPAATFVTLTRDGHLHGCIGSIAPRRSLREDVKHNAVAAALHDPRATHLEAGDAADLGIEVSLLSALSPMPFRDEADALAQLRPHVDGVVLTLGGRRATFLPQVWRKLPAPAEFMAHLKAKAGLPMDVWHPEMEIERFTLQKWGDDPDGPEEAASRSPT